MIEEKKHIFKFMWWDDYRDMKDTIAELITNEKEFDKKIDAKEEMIYKYNLKISRLEDEVEKLKLEKLKINDYINQLEAKELEITQLKKKHAKEKSDLNSELKSSKTELKNTKDELKKVQKELKDLKEKGVTIPTKVKGSTMPRKGQKLKETINTVKN